MPAEWIRFRGEYKLNEFPIPPKKEISTEVRTIFAFVLMGLILLATPYVYRMLGISTAPPAGAHTAAKYGSNHRFSRKPQPSAHRRRHSHRGAASSSGAAAPETVAAASEQEQAIDTPRYHVVFSNRGAVVKSWTLKDLQRLDR